MLENVLEIDGLLINKHDLKSIKLGFQMFSEKYQNIPI